MDVTNKVALITGAASGIGEGIATTLSKNGAHAIIADINLSNAENVSTKLTSLGLKSSPITLDVTDIESVNQCVAYVLKEFKHIDILINNAGTVGSPGWESREVPNENDWDLIFEVNVKGIVKMTEAVQVSMINNRYGKIINIASIAGRQGSERNPPYNVSKASVINLTQSHAMQLAKHNINVNAICPGLLWTPIWERIGNRRSMSPNLEELDPKQLFLNYVEEKIPLNRPQIPEDIGNLACFLASDYSINITGQSINVSGGYFMN